MKSQMLLSLKNFIGLPMPRVLKMTTLSCSYKVKNHSINNNIVRGRSYYKTKSIRRRFITCVDVHENSIIKHSILFEKYHCVFANSIIKHSRVRNFNYKTSHYLDNSIIKQPIARKFNNKTSK